MIKVMFVCHGNICRSPMAEFVFRKMVKDLGAACDFQIASSATSTEEVGNRVHPGTRKILAQHGIGCDGKVSVQFRRADYAAHDYIVAMDTRNLRNLERIIGTDTQQKVARLMDYTSTPKDIADPWYTGDFELTYEEVVRGCEALLSAIFANENRQKYE